MKDEHIVTIDAKMAPQLYLHSVVTAVLSILKSSYQKKLTYESAFGVMIHEPK